MLLMKALDPKSSVISQIVVGNTRRITPCAPACYYVRRSKGILHGRFNPPTAAVSDCPAGGGFNFFPCLRNYQYIHPATVVY